MSAEIGVFEIEDGRLLGKAYIWHLELTSGRELSILSPWHNKYKAGPSAHGRQRFYRVKETTAGAESFTYEIIQVEEVWLEIQHVCLSARGRKGIRNIDCVVVPYAPDSRWESAAHACLQ